MPAGRPITEGMSLKTRNWLCLGGAVLLNALVTRFDSPMAVFEVIGLTLPATIPAFALQQWSKTPRVVHAWTLGLTLFATLARLSAGH